MSLGKVAQSVRPPTLSEHLLILAEHHFLQSERPFLQSERSLIQAEHPFLHAELPLKLFARHDTVIANHEISVSLSESTYFL